MWCSSLHSWHDQKGRHPGRSPTCIWITICLADSLHQIFMCAFAVWKTKTNLFTNLNVHDCLPDFYVRPCLRASMHWRVKGQKWRCYPLVIHHEGDTLSPALRDAQAMFYKRITRQRAPTGHPLPHSAHRCRTRGLQVFTAHPAYPLPVQQHLLCCPSFGLEDFVKYMSF